MATYTDMYNCQVAACQEFFHEQLPDVPKCTLLKEEHDIPKGMELYAKPIFLYNITGFNAHEVIAVLVKIINDRETFTSGKNFYLMLQNSNESKEDEQIEELFRLKANPKKTQPGNGIVFLRPRGKRKFDPHAKDYAEINGALEAHYEKDTKSFAEDLKNLFLSNAVVKSDFPQATIETYMILLFEIARRLVALEKPSTSKVQYDLLPIGSAIAGIVKLLEYGQEKICKFQEVFFPGGKFHCFSGSLQERKNAIINIIKAVLTLKIKATKDKATKDKATKDKATKNKATKIKPAAPLTKEQFLEKATKYYLNKLQQTFKSRFQGLKTGGKKKASEICTSSTLKSSVDTETITAFDHYE